MATMLADRCQKCGRAEFIETLCQRCSLDTLAALGNVKTCAIAGPLHAIFVHGVFAGVAALTSPLDDAADGRYKTQHSLLVSLSSWATKWAMRRLRTPPALAEGIEMLGLFEPPDDDLEADENET